MKRVLVKNLGKKENHDLTINVLDRYRNRNSQNGSKQGRFPCNRKRREKIEKTSTNYDISMASNNNNFITKRSKRKIQRKSQTWSTAQLPACGA